MEGLNDMIFAILVISILTLAGVIGLYLKNLTSDTSSNDGINIRDDARVLDAIEKARNQFDVLGDEIRPRLKNIDQDTNWLVQQWKKFSKGS